MDDSSLFFNDCFTTKIQFSGSFQNIFKCQLKLSVEKPINHNPNSKHTYIAHMNFYVSLKFKFSNIIIRDLKLKRVLFQKSLLNIFGVFFRFFYPSSPRFFKFLFLLWIFLQLKMSGRIVFLKFEI